MKPVCQFDKYLDNFPISVHDYLEAIPQNRGMLAAGHCRAILDTLEISIDELMLQLLPIARLYSRTAISGFQVGAVVKAAISNKSDGTALYFGANFEFPGQALSQTIHAEQAAVVNAWQQGARQIETIAVTAAPCGCCRQFLYELEDSQDLTILLADKGGKKPIRYDLPDILPQAFGPQDLEVSSGLTEHTAQSPDLRLIPASNDQLVQKAHSAARRSYAPYSKNLAGCAIQTDNDKTYAGPYAENAAFNPSLSPLHTAIISMMMDHFGSDNRITRAALVEKPTGISQRSVCEQLLQTVAPDVVLEYHVAD